MTSAAASMPARTAGRLRSWLSVRHSLPAEAAVVLALYGLYEVARGLVVGEAGDAVRHARELIALERSLQVFVEGWPFTPSTMARPRTSARRRHRRFQPTRGEGLCLSLPLLDRAA